MYNMLYFGHLRKICRSSDSMVGFPKPASIFVRSPRVMYKRITEFVLLFFFLLTLFNAEAGWFGVQTGSGKLVCENPFSSNDWDHEDDLPTDAEEDSTEENREVDEYESHFACYAATSEDPLLNLHYTHQHLLFKQHFRELNVPPPKA